MKCVHLGEVVDIDPRIAASENSLLRSLRRHGPSRTKNLWGRFDRGLGREFFDQVLEGLVERGLVMRETTNHINSHIYRLVPEKRAEKRVQRLEIREPLTPESA